MRLAQEFVPYINPIRRLLLLMIDSSVDGSAVDMLDNVGDRFLRLNVWLESTSSGKHIDIHDYRLLIVSDLAWMLILLENQEGQATRNLASC
jgi:hypothetical protein